MTRRLTESEREARWAKAMLARLPPRDECISRLPERYRELGSRVFDEISHMAEQSSSSSEEVRTNDLPTETR